MIYAKPSDLSLFVDICFSELNLHEGNFDDLTEFLDELLELFGQYVNTNFNHDYDLPYYLRAFTAGQKFVETLSHGVNLLIQKEEFERAAAFLKVLTAQTIYCMNEIGEWYIKLIQIQVRVFSF